MCLEIVLKNDEAHQVSRQFYRSLIKFLVGKKDVAMRTVNKIATFVGFDVVEEETYKKQFVELLNKFNEEYEMKKEYYDALLELINEIKD
jgi:hypothetical protein